MSEIFIKVALVFCSISLFLVALYLLYTFKEEFRKDRILTLCYHRPSSLLTRGISRSGLIYMNYSIRFQEQISYLFNHGHQAISISDLLACYEGKQKLPPKPLLIMLDNGYLSNYLHIYQIIQKYDFPAVMFVTPDPQSEVFTSLKGIDLPMTKRQISEMHQSTILIGSHGMTTRPFVKLCEEDVMWEMSESKRLIEEIISEKVECLAIPYHDFLDKRTQFLAQNAGYKIIFGNRIGTNSRRSNPLNLRELTIHRDMDLHEFRKFVSPASIYRQRIFSDIKTCPGALRDRIKSIRRKKHPDPNVSTEGKSNG
ncbi:MAG: polysaccharide deacetylase family protein [bacterium]